MIELILFAIISSAIAFFVVFLMTPPLIKFLEKNNTTVRDVNKKGKVMIARPGGPAIIIGIVASEIILYAFLQINEILVIILTTSIAFLIGYVDDRKVMGKWFKPILLVFAAAPIIIFGAYDSDLIFPLFGAVNIPVLYIGLVILMIPITGNTINSIDVLNGVSSGFMVIASFSLIICLIIIENYEIVMASLPMAFVSLAFYRYHKIPSRIFPGDSGALTLGAFYGTIAIVGGVEIVAAVALLPAIINSFLFLSSTKKSTDVKSGITKGTPVEHTDDFRLKATKDKTSPITLVRLLLAAGPLSEKQVAIEIFKLAIFSGILAIITAIMMRTSL